MRLNPECRRNLTLEINLHRLVALPIVLFLACSLAYILAHEGGGLNVAGWTAFWLFAACAIVGGTQLACASMLDEMREKTWDSQRLSALSPWTLAWGKLFGSTVLAWYGGAVCLLIFVVSRLVDFNGSPPEIPVIVLCLAVPGAAVLMHAVGMLACLLIPRSGQRNTSNVIALSLFALFAGWPLGTGLMNHNPVFWWGVSWNAPWFSVISCWLFAAWAVTGLYRRLCVELQVRTVPVVWIGWAAFLSIYLAGFAVGQFGSGMTAGAALASGGFVVTLCMTYVSAWVEKRDAITVRRLLLRYRNGEWRRTLEEMPCWLATAPLVLLFSLYLSMRSGGLSLPGMMAEHMTSAMALVAALMALRDVALLHYFSFSRNARNVEMTAIIYLLVLYWIFPAICSAVGLEMVSHLLLPYQSGSLTFALVASIAQLGIVGWMAHRRWREHISAVGGA